LPSTVPATSKPHPVDVLLHFTLVSARLPHDDTGYQPNTGAVPDPSVGQLSVANVFTYSLGFAESYSAERHSVFASWIDSHVDGGYVPDTGISKVSSLGHVEVVKLRSCPVLAAAS
jgi:hypothetical protein